MWPNISRIFPFSRPKCRFFRLLSLNRSGVFETPGRSKTHVWSSLGHLARASAAVKAAGVSQDDPESTPALQKHGVGRSRCGQKSVSIVPVMADFGQPSGRPTLAKLTLVCVRGSKCSWCYWLVSGCVGAVLGVRRCPSVFLGDRNTSHVIFLMHVARLIVNILTAWLKMSQSSKCLLCAFIPSTCHP